MSESSEGGLNKRRPVREEPRAPASGTEDFNKELTALMPKLLKRAKYLTRDNKAEAEDITQETLRKAWEKREEYFKEGTDLAAWMFEILKNTYLDMRDNADTRRVVRGDDAEAIINAARNHESTEDRLDLRRVVGKILKAIEGLHPRQSQATKLAALGHTEDEIAHAMDISKGSVKVHRSRGREDLKSGLQNDDLDILRSATNLNQ